jgi:hypothetical protein
MKKSLLVAAALFSATTATQLAQVAKAAPQFKVTAASPGTIDFTGSGTAQFNNSIGTNNSFQVGSSTNLGVNASASSTPEYGVDGQARLDLAGTTTMKQVIGTSGNAQNTTNTATAASTVAHDVATKRANSRAAEAQSSFDAEYGSSYTAYVDREVSAGRANRNGTTGEVSWSGSAQYTREADFTAARKNSYSSKFDSEYAAEYGSEFTRSLSNIQSADASTTDSGTIKGTFKTIETGSAQSAGSQSDWSTGASSSAKAAAERSYGVSYEAGRTYGSGSAAVTYASEGEWQAAYDREYNSEYSRSYAVAAAGASRSSDSSVEVNGIGSDANIAAASTSTFDVKIEGTDNSSLDFGSTATANGSAGANLSTSSFANQAQSSTASGFMQAFGGDSGGFGTVDGTTTGTYTTTTSTLLTPDP